MDTPRIGILGFGEVGQRFAADLRAAGAGRKLATFDLLLHQAAAGEPMRRHAAAHDVELLTDASGLADCDLVFSAVTAAQTRAAAASLCAQPLDDTLVVDLNSAAPATKIECAALIASAGGRYVEAAVMTSVPPHGIRVPMLLGGAHATTAEKVLRDLGFVATTVSAELGIASAIKLCRSVIIKGLESLVVESFTAARAFGVEQQVLASLQETYPQFDWEKQGDYLFSRVIQHGKRRAEEMRASAEMIDASGVGGVMGGAAAIRQAGVAAGREAGAFDDPTKLKPWRDRADEILEWCRVGKPGKLRCGGGEFDEAEVFPVSRPGTIPMIIDCHGHYTTAPEPLNAWRKTQTQSLEKGIDADKGRISISDDEIRQTLENAQLKLQRARGTDVTIFSPRASAMGHHLGNETTSRFWSEHCNELIHRVVGLYPENFIGVCQLPQSPGVDPRAVIPELERCVNEFGFVGCNLNPDPSGGKFSEPPLTDRWWYPVYEKLCELDVPAMVHVSQACNPAFHTTGSYYLSADTVAFMQLMMSDLFKDFPTLRFIIPHGGGAVPFHWGRFRGIAQDQKRPPLPELMRNNVFFDTCVYHQPGIDLLLKVVPIDNILFASEMVGAVRGVDPETGHYFDDTKRYIDASSLSAADKQKVFEGNIRRVFPRMGSLPNSRKRGQTS